MALSYAQVGLTLSPSPTFSSLVRDLQRDLRSLGYYSATIDGVFLSMTTRAVSALQYDLLNNAGNSSSGDGSAPVAITSYNNGRVNAITGVVNQNLVGCISDMLGDMAYPKVPSSGSATADNQRALDAVAAMGSSKVPFPFLYGILMQESGCQHFHVPSSSNPDSFVTVGLDANDRENPCHITSRGFGIGQFTLFHHPPTPDEINNFIGDPVKNVGQAINELLEKFNRYVNGPADQADDRIHEVGDGPLRICIYPPTDARYMKDCLACLQNARTQNIIAEETLVYPGSSMTYAHTQYHEGSYDEVPIRAKIPCDWPYAVRRYNGSGPNSYDYQAEVLSKILNAPTK